MALSPTQVKFIRRLLHSGNEVKTAHALEKIHPADIAGLFADLSANETESLINSLFVIAKAGETLAELPEFILPDILDMIDDVKMASMIGRLQTDDALFILEKVPESRWPIIFENLPAEKRVKLDKLLLYPKNSAGSMMTSGFAKVDMSMTVDEAIQSIRKQQDVESLLYIYVVDNKRLVGVQSLRNLVISAPETKVADIMNRNVISVLATTPKEEVAEKVSQYNFLAIPVIIESGELVGVITVDDVVDVVREEASQDLYHLAGLSEEDRAITPLFTKIKKRLPWMVLNLVTASVSAFVISLFEVSIQSVVILAAFMPVIAGLGGNVGTQSLTVMTRSIALGELGFIKAYKVILKEVGNGFFVGIICGILMASAAYFLEGKLVLSLLILISMIFNMVMGGLVGSIIPILFKRFNLDPAVGTSVLVTLFTDSLGFLFFLGSATVMLQYLK